MRPLGTFRMIPGPLSIFLWQKVMPRTIGSVPCQVRASRNKPQKRELYKVPRREVGKQCLRHVGGLTPRFGRSPQIAEHCDSANPNTLARASRSVVRTVDAG